MIILKYDPYVGNAMPEGRVSQYVKDTLAEYHNDANNINNQYTITFGQSLILQYFRIAVKEGRLDKADIRQYGLKSSTGRSPTKSGDFKSYTRSARNRQKSRLYFKRKERSLGKRMCCESDN
jgi:hypothetical protein